MRSFWQSGATREAAFRKQQLLALKNALIQYEEKIYEALYADLKKEREECWVTENGFVLAELNHALRNLERWMETEPVSTNLVNFPSASYIMKEPLGVVLIIGPWNYPLQLLLTPLIGAIAAGNCVVLKPSEFAPATARIIHEIIESVFDPGYVLCVQGDGAEVVPAMMNGFRFNHVFYTGSGEIGRRISLMAAEQLVPVTLELGGKSPCIVEQDADIVIAAKRIAMTKFSNAGQMCVAPDYVLVHGSKKEQLLHELKKCVRSFFTEQPETCHNYGKIINFRQFDRIVKYLEDVNVVYGGRHNRETLFIEPTIIDTPAADDAVMQEEIFGPLLPVIAFEAREEALAMIERHPDPLAFYVFTSSDDCAKKWLEAVPSGGACINNASWHLTNPSLPFGGRGTSGTGAYHGRQTFDTFTHRRAVMKTPTWFDPFIKYPPLKGRLRLFKWLIK